MNKTPQNRLFRFIILTLLILLLIFSIILIYNWSNKLSKEYEKNKLKQNVQKVLEEEGERGLLSLADVNVDEIFYNEDSVSLVLDDSSSWLYTSEEMHNIKLYEKCSNSVVHISGSSSTSDVVSYNRTNKSGSGVILSSKGDILTNYHVIEDLDNIIVTLSDGSYYSATITGSDSVDDIALIKIDVEKKELVPVDLGNSFNLKVGQKVYAIGNPYGYDRTLTTGIVSGLDRAVQTSDDAIIMGMIQTDASINPGNSGGPLLNSHYEMIGMNTSVYGENGQSGMNFAIPIDTILSIIPDLINYGKVMRGWIDIVPVQLTKQLADYARLDVEKGVLISQVVNGGKADEAGLKGGDIKIAYGASTLYLGGDVITKIDNKPIESYNDFYNALLTTRMGDKVKVTINREGDELVKTVELVERSEEMDKVVQ
ncbi:MAG: S1C family serine protease [Pleomorphochaeta sp.]